MVSEKQLSEAARAMARRGFRARIAKYGIERIREIARENGKKGGRPPTAGGTRG